MSNKYQETIYNLVHLNKARGEVFIDHKQLQQDIDILWELYNKYDELTKTPTLEEVKKEWEALWYKCICDDEDLLEFEHEFLPMNIEFNKEHMWYGSTSNDITQFTIREHLLITKTFRALGWFDE